MYSLMKLFLSFLFFGGIIGVLASNQLVGPKNTPKLFAFGDSYADTGNMDQKAPRNVDQDVVSWNPPYGITYPGKPSGRSSDGLIATDFLAKELGAKPPTLWRTHVKNKRLNIGMNFAYGESTLFEGYRTWPNTSGQIGLLVDLLVAERVYTFADLTSSDVAFISYAGDDYLQFIFNNDLKNYQGYIRFIIEDLRHCMWKLDATGIKNIAITSLLPLGCLPHVTFTTSFQKCNESYSGLVDLHNKMLRETVAKLNEEAKVRKKEQRFFIIDIHKAFRTLMNKKGNTKFKNILKPCCEGDCGKVDKGVKKYTLCNDPKSYFFWDKVNPTQEGWRSIYSELGNPIRQSLTTNG